MNTAIKEIIFVTGYSGAGMSTALDSLEDLSFEVLDNFPISLLPSLLDDPMPKSARLAIGIDTRTRNFDPASILAAKDRVKAKLLFLCADDAVLQKRFTETRRKHPLAMDRPVSDGIAKEHTLLGNLRAAADYVIDTSELSVHDLRRTIAGHFKAEAATTLTLNIMSFGFKNGVPRDADNMFDVRFLRNPHWDEALRPQTGKDKDVQAYIEKDEAFAEFIERIQALLAPLLPRYRAEGKSYLTIAFGCSGGRHRSVYCAEKIGAWLQSEGHTLSVTHRDLK